MRSAVQVHALSSMHVPGCSLACVAVSIFFGQGSKMQDYFDMDAVDLTFWLISQKKERERERERLCGVHITIQDMVAGASVGCVPAQLKTTLAIKHHSVTAKEMGVCLVQTESYNTWFLHGREIVQKICNSSQKKKKNPNSGGSHLLSFLLLFFYIYFITKIK